jgi:hypothetical protein
MEAMLGTRQVDLHFNETRCQTAMSQFLEYAQLGMEGDS